MAAARLSILFLTILVIGESFIFKKASLNVISFDSAGSAVYKQVFIHENLFEKVGLCKYIAPIILEKMIQALTSMRFMENLKDTLLSINVSSFRSFQSTVKRPAEILRTNLMERRWNGEFLFRSLLRSLLSVCYVMVEY